MSTMIERAAKALYENEYKGRVWEWDDVELDENFPHIRRDCRHAARVAIEAMREPTQAMVARGSWASYGGGEIGSTGSKNAWHKMIDAALKE